MWVQKAGLEWAYRWKQEPRRMFRRNAVDMPKFVAMVLASKVLGLEVPTSRRKIAIAVVQLPFQIGWDEQVFPTTLERLAYQRLNR